MVQIHPDPDTQPVAAGAAATASERDPANLARKIVVGAAGGVVTTAGLVMLVTPGPGIVVTLAGLSILGSEFAAARRAREKIRDTVRRSTT